MLFCLPYKLLEPFKPLLKGSVAWSWDFLQQEAFQAIKEELTKTPILAYFNPRSEHIIQADALVKGLGTVVLQEGHPVMSYSHS